jgi:hypothetical protein
LSLSRSLAAEWDSDFRSPSRDLDRKKSQIELRKIY